MLCVRVHVCVFSCYVQSIAVGLVVCACPYVLNIYNMFMRLSVCVCVAVGRGFASASVARMGGGICDDDDDDAGGGMHCWCNSGIPRTETRFLPETSSRASHARTHTRARHLIYSIAARNCKGRQLPSLVHPPTATHQHTHTRTCRHIHAIHKRRTPKTVRGWLSHARHIPRLDFINRVVLGLWCYVRGYFVCARVCVTTAAAYKAVLRERTRAANRTHARRCAYPLVRSLSSCSYIKRDRQSIKGFRTRGVRTLRIGG